MGPSRLLRLIVGVCASAVAALSGRAAHAEARAAVASIDSGAIVGTEDEGIRAFLGIPYAAAPVGALRWKAPAPPSPWGGPRPATRRGLACPQLDHGFVRQTGEDCLTVNVWAPVVPSGARLPVMVWIHGGAFFEGSGGDDLYDGALLARQTHAVVVTMNYRLGPLGFLSHPALAAEAGRAVSPSVGLLDQQAALHWVHRNAAAFGGDPAKVTIFGESAGAWSVCTHLVMPGSRGLFARAIIESGACSDPLYFDGPRANAQGAAFARQLGCATGDTARCLREKPVNAILAALPLKRGVVLPPGVWWGPVIDGVELPRQPLDAIRAGQFARVPVIVGWNQDEGTIHTVALPTVTTADLRSFVGDSFQPTTVSAVLDRYGQRPPKQALTEIFTDGVFACSARRVARALADHDVPVFLYEWTRALDAPQAHALGATHNIELFFLWGNPGNGISLSPAERPLSRMMMDTWARFARDGDPSAPGLPWARYTTAQDALMTLDLRPAPRAGVKREICDFWDRVQRRGDEAGRHQRATGIGDRR